MTSEAKCGATSPIFGPDIPCEKPAGHDGCHRGMDRSGRYEIACGWDASDCVHRSDDDPGPYVCPGCYTVGGGPCAPGCIDDEVEREREDEAQRRRDDDAGMFPEEHDDD